MTSSSRLETGHSTTPNSPSAERSNGTMLLQVNGRTCEILADCTTPLLHVLRNDLWLNGTKFRPVDPTSVSSAWVYPSDWSNPSGGCAYPPDCWYAGSCDPNGG